jgi:MFS family permease
VLLVSSPESLTIANGVTFAISALVLARLPFGETPVRVEARRSSLLQEAREGLSATVGMTGIRIVLGVSAGALFFAGLFNVAELPFAEDVLGSTDVGYSVLATAFGLGFIGGSLSGSRGGSPQLLKARYRLGLLVLAAGFLSSGVAPNFAAALVAFAIAGLGNGMLLVFERQIIQAFVPDRLAGRVFGIKDALSAWAFGSAFICAGALVSLLGVRELLIAAGVGTVAAWLASVYALRGALEEREAVAERGGSGASAEPLGQ